MKKVYIIHSWEGTSELFWIPQIAEYLRGLDYDVITPDMPNTDEPKIKEWVGYLKEIAQEIDQETIFIGHSIGCQTIMRFLAGQDKKIRKCIFVAGWFDLKNLEDTESEEIAKPWLETPIDFEKIKENTEDILVVLGSDDEWVPVDVTREKFEKNLDARVDVIEGYEHMDDNLENLPKLEEILKNNFNN